MLTDHKEIKRWLDSVGVENYTIRPDGIVDVDGGVDLRVEIGSTLPVQFGIVTGCFDCFCTSITSLRGAPFEVGGDFICSSTSVTSFENIPSKIGGGVYCHNTYIKSLSGIHKAIKQANGTFSVPGGVTHILGLLLVEGITNIDMDSGGPIDKIMNKYVETGDIISAQDELIDAGFKEQAKL